MTNYIKENHLDECGWETDCDIRAFATLCQIDVCTYSEYVIGLNHLHIVNVLRTVNIELMYMYYVWVACMYSFGAVTCTCTCVGDM